MEWFAEDEVAAASRGSQHYAEDWPCMAFLGVSSKLQYKAAETLLGKNIWRISQPFYMDESGAISTCPFYQFYEHYFDFFRSITIHFDMRDVPQSMLLDFAKWTHGQTDHRLRRVSTHAHESDSRHAQELHRGMCARMKTEMEFKIHIMLSMSLEACILDLENL